MSCSQPKAPMLYAWATSAEVPCHLLQVPSTSHAIFDFATTVSIWHNCYFGGIQRPWKGKSSSFRHASKAQARLEAIASRSKDATGLTTRSKKPLGTKGIVATRSKGHYEGLLASLLGARTLVGWRHTLLGPTSRLEGTPTSPSPRPFITWARP